MIDKGAPGGVHALSVRCLAGASDVAIPPVLWYHANG